MALAAGPTFLWVNSTILGQSEPKVLGYSTDFSSYNQLIPNENKSFEDNNKSEEEIQEIDISPTETPSPSPTSTPDVVAQVASQEKSRPAAVQNAPTKFNALIDKYAGEYGADPNMMKKIAKCESGYNPEAISPSGAYHGLYQFVAGTWVSNRNAMGLDPNLELRRDPEEAIKTAAFKMGRDGYGAWPVCSRI